MAQNDTEFWFGAPENKEYTSSPRDRPIYIRVSTFDQTATVTLSQPARPEFTPLIQVLPANSTYCYVLTPFIDFIETKDPNSIKNFGLKLNATAPVTAYYEQASNGNPDIFTLKGKNSLGTRFVIPSQNNYSNTCRYPDGSCNKYNSFVIVATQNNTTVTITPAKNIVGHTAGIPYTIVLNAGQTYSATAVSQSASEHLIGSLVTSDKPIAITINDDSVIQQYDSGGPDLVGDQIIPSSVMGKDYVFVKGYFSQSNSSTDRVYIIADSNNTVISINGSYVTTLNATQYYNYAFGAENALSLTASKPVIAFHLSGYEQQPAGAIIPPIQCTGSNEIVFVRSDVTGTVTQKRFGLIVFTRSGNENGFSVSPNDFSLSASDFQPVPGTSGSWLYTRKPLNSTSGTLIVKENTAYRISNSQGLFHLGILYGNPDNNARYGFYSNFASVNLGPDQTICPGDSVLLDAGAGKDAYLWNTGATTHSIWVKNQGTYYVDVTDYLCQISDTMVLAHYPVAPINLGPDTAICTGTTITLDAGAGFSVYSWSNGGHNRTTTVGPGTYTVTASIAGSCNSMDTIIIGSQPLPTPVPIRHN
ncbi:MAG TPA: hypothetical protein DEO70_06110 [Bacteroidales bacterium]|nr:MAG: hypothetical protein A2X11_03780 [Bacteroidetes bacterium GWE2_42_24]OFY29793.1 MAG: hypothetical protein A2X09_13095 [Bacteroidetes bacterium GWF2_43_11]HBZ66396.1 hypothetical protein [Bacteroidales bacterium]